MGGKVSGSFGQHTGCQIVQHEVQSKRAIAPRAGLVVEEVPCDALKNVTTVEIVLAESHECFDFGLSNPAFKSFLKFFFLIAATEGEGRVETRCWECGLPGHHNAG